MAQSSKKMRKVHFWGTEWIQIPKIPNRFLKSCHLSFSSFFFICKKNVLKLFGQKIYESKKTSMVLTEDIMFNEFLYLQPFWSSIHKILKETLKSWIANPASTLDIKIFIRASLETPRNPYDFPVK